MNFSADPSNYSSPVKAALKKFKDGDNYSSISFEEIEKS